MNIAQLIDALSEAQVYGPTSHTISSLAYDSRQVQPGSLFVAISGFHVDGHTYIPQALQQGAAALVVDARRWPTLTLDLPPSMTVIVVPDSRVALAPLAAAFYGYPAHYLGMVGVTGTKGKTTTTALISRTLESGGYRTGMINSVDFKVDTEQWPNTTRQSTPEAPEVQALLHDMLRAGCDYGVVEATSHALSPRWRRVDSCAFDVAVLTNLSHEHLDFHGTLEQYRSDKARLFEMLGSVTPGNAAPGAKSEPYAIVNADDPSHTYFLDAAPAAARRLTYGIEQPADIRATDAATGSGGTDMHVTTPWGKAQVRLRLPGLFNVSNALAAMTVALTQGVPLECASAAMADIDGVRGRMERIEQGQPFAVIVDYAHNPDSFTRVLEMLRPLVERRIIAVFGSAGERDREKRPLQGAIAARYCDLLVLTDEDPRREDPEHIIAEIAAGAEQAGKRRDQEYLMIPDRTAAIRAAFERARPGDMVLLLGKGHESSIEYPEGKRPWDEMAVARAALHELGWQASPIDRNHRHVSHG